MISDTNSTNHLHNILQHRNIMWILQSFLLQYKKQITLSSLCLKTIFWALANMVC